MTINHQNGRALTGPTDHRHIPQILDAITGISASEDAGVLFGIHRGGGRGGYVRRSRVGLTRFAAPGSLRCLSTGAGTRHAPFQRVTELAVRAARSTRSLSRDVRATP